MKHFFKILTIILGSALFQHEALAQLVSANEITIAPMLHVSVAGGKSSVREGEQVLLKVKGNDEFSAMQWQVSLDGIHWQDIPKATGNNFETLPITQRQFFRVVCRPLDATEKDVATISNVQVVGLEDNVASRKKD